MDRFRMLPSYHFYDVEGNSSLTLEKSVGKPLRDYKIYGVCGDLITDVTDANYGKYKIPIKVRGKNLFDSERFYNELKAKENMSIPILTGTDEGYNYIAVNPAAHNNNNFQFMKNEFKENTQYTISFMGKSEHNHFTGIRIVYTDGTSSSQSVRSGMVWQSYTHTTTINKTISHITFYYGANGYAYYANIQLEEGTTATGYEPYKEPIKINIYLDEPLKNGEYIDFINQKLVKAEGETPMNLPTINTFKGLNIVSVDADTQPTNMKIQYYK